MVRPPQGGSWQAAATEEVIGTLPNLRRGKQERGQRKKKKMVKWKSHTKTHNERPEFDEEKTSEKERLPLSVFSPFSAELIFQKGQSAIKKADTPNCGLNAYVLFQSERGPLSQNVAIDRQNVSGEQDISPASRGGEPREQNKKFQQLLRSKVNFSLGRRRGKRRCVRSKTPTA